MKNEANTMLYCDVCGEKHAAQDVSHLVYANSIVCSPCEAILEKDLHEDHLCPECDTAGVTVSVDILGQCPHCEEYPFSF